MKFYRRRKKTILILFLMSLLSSACFHQSTVGDVETVTPPSPTLELAAENIDFGSIVPGQRANRTLTLENSGSGPLQIFTVRTSDPFQLKAHLTESAIPASGAAQMQIDLVPEVYLSGPYQGEIVIYSDDPDQRIAKVKVAASIDSPIKWRPLFINHLIQQGQPAKLPEILIASQKKHGIGPVTVESSLPIVHAKAKALDGYSYVVTLELDPDVPMGATDGMITVKTQHSEMPVINIPLMLYVTGDLMVDVSSLEFGILEPNTSASADISLTQQGDRPVRIIRVDSHLPVECDVSIDKTPTGYALTVGLTAWPPLQSLKGYLSIFTDHPTQPRLDVPTEGWVAAEVPFTLDGGEGTNDKIFQLLLYALYLEESLTPEDVVEHILGGHRGERSVALLLRAFASENWHTRQRAMQVLGLIGSNHAVATIRKAVTEDPDEDVRGAAVAALADIAGAAALPELELALQDNDELIRADAARLLGELNNPRAVPWLLRAKSDEDDLVREAAERALNSMTVRTD